MAAWDFGANSSVEVACPSAVLIGNLQIGQKIVGSSRPIGEWHRQFYALEQEFSDKFPHSSSERQIVVGQEIVTVDHHAQSEILVTSKVRVVWVGREIFPVDLPSVILE